MICAFKGQIKYEVVPKSLQTRARERGNLISVWEGHLKYNAALIEKTNDIINQTHEDAHIR